MFLPSFENQSSRKLCLVEHLGKKRIAGDRASRLMGISTEVVTVMMDALATVAVRMIMTMIVTKEVNLVFIPPATIFIPPPAKALHLQAVGQILSQNLLPLLHFVNGHIPSVLLL